MKAIIENIKKDKIWSLVKEKELNRVYEMAISIDDKMGGKRKLQDIKRHMAFFANGYWNKILTAEGKKIIKAQTDEMFRKSRGIAKQRATQVA